MNWEFKYVRLELEQGRSQDDAYGDRVNVIAQLGREGWEPVGEVTFSQATPPAQLRRLMFKRPVQA